MPGLLVSPTFTGGIEMNRIRPNLLSDVIDGDCETLNLPNIEWAGKIRTGDEARYEFIGEEAALLNLGLAKPPMLAVGSSGRKDVADEHGSRCRVQRLTNERFRLEFQLMNLAEIQSVDMMLAQIQYAHNVPEFSKGKPAKTADMEASLKTLNAIIKKYPMSARKGLSEGLFAYGRNGWQLAESFPWLAVCVFTTTSYKVRDAHKMIRDGERLRDIADHVGIPMSFKRFRPGVCSKRLAKIKPILYPHPEIVSHHCPKVLAKQRAWIRTIFKALQSGGEEFALWAAVHWKEIPGRYNDIPEAVNDIGDWVKAGMIARARDGERHFQSLALA